MKKRSFLIANVSIPLLIGALFYLFTSTNVIFVRVIYTFWGISGDSDQIIENGIIFNIFRYYLSDIMWAYALVFALFIALGCNAAKLKQTFGIAIVFSTIMEVIQLIPMIPGVFDLIDILVEAVAEIFAVLIIKNSIKEANSTCETK